LGAWGRSPQLDDGLVLLELDDGGELREREVRLLAHRGLAQRLEQRGLVRFEDPNVLLENVCERLPRKRDWLGERQAPRVILVVGDDLRSLDGHEGPFYTDALLPPVPEVVFNNPH
jgi:hypothetical protein